MPRTSESSPQRRLTTPERLEGSTRSRTGKNRSSRSRSYRSRSPIRSPHHERSPRVCEREPSRHDLNRRYVEDRDTGDRDLSCSRMLSSLRERELEVDRKKEQLRILEEEVNRKRRQLDHQDRGHRGKGGAAAGDTRSCSPTFTAKDIVDILRSLKPQAETVGAVLPSTSSNINHKNILPDFDPSLKSQRTDIWIKKVNECATVYGWDERTTVHFAMQKLQGLAKVWYESQNSILFNWSEWQEKLLNAFPCQQNYGQSLEDMLRRKSRYNEPLEVYYYEKLALLNQCDIDGKRAVDCLIHGLTDRTMRSSANALRCTQPDQLLQFLISNQEPSHSIDQSRVKIKVMPEQNSSYNSNPIRRPFNKTFNNQVYCFNCKERGHPYSKCTKPIIQCTKCKRFGHKIETCMFNNDSPLDQRQKVDSIPKTMRILTSNTNSKYLKECTINETVITGFVDFGSEVSLITLSAAKSLGLTWDKISIPIRGFGNEIVHSLGRVKVNLSVDGVRAEVLCQVIEDIYLDVPLLIGQSFTEQPHILVCKDVNELKFYVVDNDFENFDFPRSCELLSSVTLLADLDIFGPVTVKCHVNPSYNGNILLNHKIIGRPNQQFLVQGGVYHDREGTVFVSIIPIYGVVLLRQGIVIARGTKVQVVNRIIGPSKAIQVQSVESFNETEVKIGDSISETQKQALLELLKKFRHCFASNLKYLGCTNMTEMDIELNSRKPVVYRPYRLSHKERGQVREMVGEMIDAGIVKESVSEYASPIILVRKKEGGVRICVDYRLLNSITVKERYPMPVIDDEIARLSGQAYFITLDLMSGYYQVPISEGSKHLTSFVTPDGQYEFNRMPFGLANAPAVFQRLINKVLGSSRFTDATAYIDDILIYGSTVEQCLERLEKILKLIEDANLTLNLKKCNFLQDRINYLGYEISSSGVRPGDKKTQCVIDFPCPKNQHSVRQFLGLVGYFRKFIKNFASLSHPLNKLLKKDSNWQWGEEQEKSFQLLKDRLIDRPILAIYNPNAQTELHTDASKIGVGGILFQRVHNCDPFRPVAYYSRQTSPEEKNFHAFELETLAVVCSLVKFRVYLLGLDFKIVTDCSALRSTFSKRDLIPRIARWWLTLQEFQCTVEYRAGTKMAHVDALSRNPINGNVVSLESEQYPTVSVMSISSDDWLATLQLGDSELRRIRDIIESKLDVEGLKYIRDNYCIKDNKLYRFLDGDKSQLRWVVPKGARWQLLRKNHDEIGHFGVEKTLDRIKTTYWFPKMSRFVKKYVQACIECAYAKRNITNEGHLHPITKIEVPFHTLHIDHLGPFVRSKLGNSYILVVVDAFTKFTFVRPVRNTKSQTTIRVLEDIFFIFRNPDRIISDRGTSFTSHAFRRFCLDKGIKHVLNAVACPRSNGQVERYNRTILNSLTAQNLNGNEKEWDHKVGAIQWGLNNTLQKTTGKTPSDVMFGTCMKSEIDPRLNDVVTETRPDIDLTTIRETVKDNIDFEQAQQKERYNKNRRPFQTYSEGDLVKISKNSFSNDGKSRKLLPSYVGPYRVVEVLDKDRYRVSAIPGLSNSKNKRKTTVAADRMSPWIHVATLNVNDDDDDDDDNESDTNGEEKNDMYIE